MMKRKTNSNRERRLRGSAGKHGFTLVEIIVTLAILAILAAIIVPTCLGYIDKAKEAKYMLETRRVSDGVQCHLMEEHATGRLDRDTGRNLIQYPLGDTNHPLTELLTGIYTEGAMITSVCVELETGKCLALTYEVEGYIIEHNLLEGTLKIKD